MTAKRRHNDVLCPLDDKDSKDCKVIKEFYLSYNSFNLLVNRSKNLNSPFATDTSENLVIANPCGVYCQNFGGISCYDRIKV